MHRPEYCRRWYAKRREQGLCIRCGKGFAPRLSDCQKCRAKLKERR